MATPGTSCPGEAIVPDVERRLDVGSEPPIGALEKRVALSEDLVHFLEQRAGLWVEQAQGVIEEVSASRRAALDDDEIIGAEGRDGNGFGQVAAGPDRLAVDLDAVAPLAHERRLDEQVSLIAGEGRSNDGGLGAIADHRLAR